MKKKVKVTVGSNNVFKDLGLPNPKKELANAQKYLVKRRRLITQIENLCGMADMSTLIEARKFLLDRR